MGDAAGRHADCLPLCWPTPARPPGRPPARRCTMPELKFKIFSCRRCRRSEDMDGFESQGNRPSRPQGGTRYAAASCSAHRQRSLRHGGLVDGFTFQWLHAWDSSLHGAAASDAAAAAAIAVASQAVIFHNADVNATSPEFDSPLHLAVLGNYVRIAQELIAK